MSEIKYELSRGSDLLRDGMYLELSITGTAPIQQVAEVFYSDITHEFFLTCYEESIPLGEIEKLIQKMGRVLYHRWSSSTENSIVSCIKQQRCLWAGNFT